MTTPTFESNDFYLCLFAFAESRRSQVDNNFGGTTIPDLYSNMSKLFKLSLTNLQWPIPDFSRIPNLSYPQVNQADKIQKENSTSVASNAHGEPKPTNLKPFRFRTDERGMFKEATSEKKVHAPLKEIALVRTPGAKSTSKHQNVIHAKHWTSWSYLEEQTGMEFLVLHEVDVHEMDVHPVSNGRKSMSPSSAFLMQAITLG
ncbi:LRR receptor-like serine/threonine-protein kinase [Pyrus ussuriensis x Pyrus communis]|uniref:LRR receptor-like serine/threonine-protein kinase n=1 Tax=Pyrus ussuriensis x Pyrus communis TaxID=2448454 RepID=A0A5N5I2A8_9ROSA|nr:LRR receptor-like serine/threonine-protein kinase [Pyrus ussuriensis x Pyrus communis]